MSRSHSIFTRLCFFLAVALQVNIAGAKPALKVGLILDRAGKDDKSFNAAAYKGAMEAQSKFGIELKTVEATDDNAYDGILRSFAKREFDLVIGIGVSQKEPIDKSSKSFPSIKYAIVDAEVTNPNVRSMMFQEHEGSFLVGAIAALTTRSNQVGFIGGMDIPLIRRFQLGYEEGVKKINPKIRVTSNYVGVTGDAWHDPGKAKELALAQYQSGADVIFAAAGVSNMGLFDAAEERKKLAIGVDSNQNWIKPGMILTSMLKRVDTAVFEVIRDAVEGKFTAGTQRYGLANGGIDYAIDKFNDPLLPKSVRDKVDVLKKEIASGKLVVPDYYKIK